LHLIFSVYHVFFTFPLFSGVTEGAFLGESTKASKKRSAAGLGVAHTVVIKCSTGPSYMHVCGAFRKGKCMAYGRYHGTYASFPADLKHRSVKLGKRRHILKLSFFFRILRKPIARPAKTPNVTKFLIAKKSIRKSPRFV